MIGDCKASGQKIVLEDACQRLKGQDPLSCIGCPIPLIPRIRPGLQARQESILESPKAQDEASKNTSSRMRKTSKKKTSIPEEPPYTSALNKLEKLIRKEWNSPHQPGGIRKRQFSRGDLQAIRKMLKLLPPERIPKDFNLHFELNRALNRYSVDKAGSQDTPGSAEVRSQLETIARLAHLLSHCLAKKHDEVRALLGGLDSIEEDIRGLAWKATLANHPSKRGRLADESLDRLVYSLIRIYRTATGEDVKRTIHRTGQPGGPPFLFMKAFFTRADISISDSAIDGYLKAVLQSLSASEKK